MEISGWSTPISYQRTKGETCLAEHCEERIVKELTLVVDMGPVRNWLMQLQQASISGNDISSSCVEQSALVSTSS